MHLDPTSEHDVEKMFYEPDHLQNYTKTQALSNSLVIPKQKEQWLFLTDLSRIKLDPFL